MKKNNNSIKTDDEKFNDRVGKLKKSMPLLFWGTLTLIIILAVSVKVDAAQRQLIKLKSDKVYTSYDVTGDSKKDKLLISNLPDELIIYINDEKVHTLHWSKLIPYFDETEESEEEYNITLYLYSLKNKSRYIDISVQSSMNDTIAYHSIYKYTFGKLVKSLDVSKTFIDGIAGEGHNAVPLKVIGNRIILKYNTGIAWSDGSLSFNIKYYPTENKLKPTIKKYKLSKVKIMGGYKTLKVYKQFSLYKNVGKRKIAFTAKSGKLLKPIKFCVMGKKSYILLKGSQKEQGWVRFNKDFTYRFVSSETRRTGDWSHTWW